MILPFIQIGTETNKQTPFLICHGENDVIVKPKYGQATAKYLNKIGFKTEFKLYPGLGHGAGLQEIEDITSYIKDRLPSSQTYLLIKNNCYYLGKPFNI